MSEPISAEAPAPALTFRESLGAIFYLGLLFVYVHLSALWTWHVIVGSSGATIPDFVAAGTALAKDVSWVIPTGVGLIIAAYFALFGDSVVSLRGRGQSTRDLAVITCLAIAAVLLGFATTTSISYFAGQDDPARAFPAIAFTLLAIALASKAGTAFWGDPTRQVRAAVREEADMRAMRQRLIEPRTTSTARLMATVGWTVVPAIVFTVIVATRQGNGTTIILSIAAFFTLALTAWSFGWFVRFRALSGQSFVRALGFLGMSITCIAVTIPFIAIWLLTDEVGRTALAILTVIVFASALVPSRVPFTIGSLARDRAYLRLTKRIVKAQTNTNNARERQRIAALPPMTN